MLFIIELAPINAATVIAIVAITAKYAPIPCDAIPYESWTTLAPYQAEISQGTLQSIFEFQSMIAEITKMDIANASMYDGANPTNTIFPVWAFAKTSPLHM